MPRKIRQLIADVRRAGFVRVPGGKGNHQKWRHPETNMLVIVSGSEGDDAKPYQERKVAFRDPGIPGTGKEWVCPRSMT